MPIKSKRELVCTQCGKKFVVVLNDAIMPNDIQSLENPVCNICKLKTKLKLKK